MMILTSKNNPFVKSVVALKEKKGRKEQGLFLIEGKKMTQEALKSKLTVRKVIVAEGENAEFSGVETVCVSQEVFRHISDEKTPQGVLCLAEIPQKRVEPPKGKCLLLDGVSDPGNMGAILRTAHACGYGEVYLSSDCVDPYSPKAVRASMSGLFFTDIYIGEREEILSVLESTPIYVADFGGENVFKVEPAEKFVLALGNEANGVSAAVRSAANKTVTIPMQSTQESLNVAVAAGVCMYLLNGKELSK
ncbi:MAG: RNA methyltransferase [Clostridia bacterium]|nr:RNA methyltransferase [Clostridia bacterium]